MSILAILIPVALGLGAIGLVVFFWTVRNGQYDDLAGDAERILFDDDKPLAPNRDAAPLAPNRDAAPVPATQERAAS